MPQPVCPKCGGFLVMHPMDDQSNVVRAARCVNCGKILDPVINAYASIQADGEKLLKHRYQRKVMHYRQQPL